MAPEPELGSMPAGSLAWKDSMRLIIRGLGVAHGSVSDRKTGLAG